jgi:hypothetical protein
VSTPELSYFGHIWRKTKEFTAYATPYKITVLIFQPKDKKKNTA